MSDEPHVDPLVLYRRDMTALRLFHVERNSLAKGCCASIHFPYPLKPYSTSALRSFSRQRPRINPMDPVASPMRLATSA